MYCATNLQILSRARPKHLKWNERLNQPEVIQEYFGTHTRITWNPDDMRFYTEHQFYYQEHDCSEWETVFTFAGDVRGFQNARNRAQRIYNGTLKPKPLGAKAA